MPAYADLVHQTTTGGGTSSLPLVAVNGKRTFNNAFGTGGANVFDYYISSREAAQWERGTGHEASGALVRDTVLASSNANALVNFSAGVKDITNDQPAALRVNKTGDTFTGNVIINPPTGGAYYTLDPTQASQQAMINFNQSGVGKWQLGKQTDNSFLLYDGASAFDVPFQGSVFNINRKLYVTAGGAQISAGASTTGLWVLGPNAQLYLDHMGGGHTYLDQSALHIRYGVNGADTVTVDGGAMSVLFATASTSPTTGALKVTGGAGIGGNVNVGGSLVVGSASAAPLSGRSFVIQSAGQPAFGFKHEAAASTKKVMGWIYDGAVALSDPGMVAQNLDDNGGFVANAAVLWRDGGLTLGGAARPAGGAGGLYVASSAASTSAATGALVVTGGVGIGGMLNVGAGGVEILATGATVLRGVGSGGASIHIDYVSSGQNYLDQTQLNLRTAGVLFAYFDNTKLALLQTTASTSTTTGALTVAGGVGIGGALSVGGTSTFPNSLSIGLATTGLYGDNGNVAIRGYSTGLIYFQSAGGAANFGTWGSTLLTVNTPLSITSSAASSNATTGALIVTGGVGVGGSINCSGACNVSSLAAQSLGLMGAATPALTFTPSSGATKTAQLYQQGDVLAIATAGVAVRADINLNNGNAKLYSTTATTSVTTGALVVSGGVGIAGGLYVGGGISAGGNVAITLNGATLTICANGGNASIAWQLSGNQYFTQALAVGNGAMYFLDLDSSHGVGIGQDQTGWSAASDRRLPYKRNARTLEGLLERIDQFRLVEFGPEHKNLGVIAQECRRFVPHIVTPGIDDDEREITNIMDPGCWTVLTAESGLVALQVAKEIWQKASGEISELKARVAQLERPALH